MKTLLFSLLLALPCAAQVCCPDGNTTGTFRIYDPPLYGPTHVEFRQGDTFGTPSYWKFSVAALAAAQASDVLTSRGHLESNPLAQGPNGEYSLSRGLALKSVYVPVIFSQWLVLRHHPKFAKAFTYFNFGGAGVTGVIAFRNSRIE
jgi:hypothetical protein